MSGVSDKGTEQRRFIDLLVFRGEGSSSSMDYRANFPLVTGETVRYC